MDIGYINYNFKQLIKQIITLLVLIPKRHRWLVKDIRDDMKAMKNCINTDFKALNQEIDSLNQSISIRDSQYNDLRTDHLETDKKLKKVEEENYYLDKANAHLGLMVDGQLTLLDSLILTQYYKLRNAGLHYRKIDVIREVRQATRWSLMESKNTVDSCATRNKIEFEEPTRLFSSMAVSKECADYLYQKCGYQFNAEGHIYNITSKMLYQGVKDFLDAHGNEVPLELSNELRDLAIRAGN